MIPIWVRLSFFVHISSCHPAQHINARATRGKACATRSAFSSTTSIRVDAGILSARSGSICQACNHQSQQITRNRTRGKSTQGFALCSSVIILPARRDRYGTRTGHTCARATKLRWIAPICGRPFLPPSYPCSTQNDCSIHQVETRHENVSSDLIPPNLFGRKHHYYLGFVFVCSLCCR